MDMRAEATPDTFLFAENVHYDAELAAWDTSTGTEPLRPHTSTRVYATYEVENPAYAVHSWVRNGVEYILVEQDQNDTSNPGVGIYVHHLDGINTEVAVRRAAPTYRDAGTQFVPLGTTLLMLNGNDRPVKFHGDDHTSSFGFLAPPQSPGVVSVDPAQMAITDAQRGGPTVTGGIAVYPQAPYDTFSFAEFDWDATAAGTGALTWAGPTAKSYFGLGLTDEGDVNSYSWKVAYVSDTGSISPLSAPSATRWIIPPNHLGATGEANETNINPAGIKYAALIADLPLGPDNCVARILYRTKNMRDGIQGAGETYYEVATIPDNTTSTYVDFIPDNELVVEAPTANESSTISQDHKVGVVWGGRLWLAGSSDGKLIYSRRGFPEQFGADDYLDMSAREGGEVTGLVAYQASLLVFRERSIEVVSPTDDSPAPYRVSVLHPALGTNATNTITAVPGVGIMFLARDGIYAISGSLSGGSQPTVQRVSDPVQLILSRLNRAAMPRACAAYSDAMKEWWVHFPADGADVASLGLVLHLQTGGWSVRGEAFSDDDSGYWDVDGMTVDRWGQTIFSPRPILPKDNPKQYNVGLHIVTRGSTLSIGLFSRTTVEGGYKYGVGQDRDLRSTFVSQWARFDTDKRQVLSVDLVLYEGVSDGVTLGHMVDERFKFTDTAVQQNVSLIHPDDQGTSLASPLWGLSTSTTARPLAEYDTAVIGNDRRTLVRVDLYPNIRDSVCWYIQDTEPVVLSGWRWGLNSTDRPQMRNRWGA